MNSITSFVVNRFRYSTLLTSFSICLPLSIGMDLNSENRTVKGTFQKALMMTPMLVVPEVSCVAIGVGYLMTKLDEN
uniref:Uncharacterized protein n=1 Tax=viral metagenome TaxID=1070528 RepID=A0A6C0BP76_9ZZZZ